MPRCAPLAAPLSLAAAIALALPVSAAHAQVQRQFPNTALRGDAQFGLPPELLLNGQPARLAPGARVHGLDNMLVLSGGLTGVRGTVNYTIDTLGQLHEVWLLRAEEAARQPWPKTPQEAAAWSFDFGSQTWSKPQ
jgi:hypothetical protein